MPKKINKGEMFVFRDKRGAYNAEVPTVWSEQKHAKKHFAPRFHRYPKLVAHSWVSNFLKEYYGAKRGEFIQSMPQFVKRMKFGCGVGMFMGTHTSNGRTYPKIAVYWTELVSNENGSMTTKRRQKHFLYSSKNKIEQQHKASLYAAKVRADVTFSYLSEKVFDFEYDLDFIKDSECAENTTTTT